MSFGDGIWYKYLMIWLNFLLYHCNLMYRFVHVPTQTSQPKETKYCGMARTSGGGFVLTGDTSSHLWEITVKWGGWWEPSHHSHATGTCACEGARCLPMRVSHNALVYVFLLLCLPSFIIILTVVHKLFTYLQLFHNSIQFSSRPSHSGNGVFALENICNHKLIPFCVLVRWDVSCDECFQEEFAD